MRNVDRDNLRALPDEINFHFLRYPAQLALWRKTVTPIQFTWLNDTEALVIVSGRIKDLLNPLRRVDSPGLSIPCDFCFPLSLSSGGMPFVRPCPIHGSADSHSPKRFGGQVISFVRRNHQWFLGGLREKRRRVVRTATTPFLYNNTLCGWGYKLSGGHH